MRSIPMKGKAFLFDRNWWSFQWRYLRRRTPWDTRITPPEVMDFLSRATPGRALDLGCGTGTNAVTMARRGWQVTGIDFAAQAIFKARLKAARRRLEIDFRVGDVTDLSGLARPFDYVLDIGCLHALDRARQVRYAEGFKGLIRPGGTFMLYAWLPRTWKGKRRGIAADAVRALFEPTLRHHRTVVGEEAGGPSAWYWFMR